MSVCSVRRKMGIDFTVASHTLRHFMCLDSGSQVCVFVHVPLQYFLKVQFMTYQLK